MHVREVQCGVRKAGSEEACDLSLTPTPVPGPSPLPSEGRPQHALSVPERVRCVRVRKGCGGVAGARGTRRGACGIGAPRSVWGQVWSLRLAGRPGVQ